MSGCKSWGKFWELETSSYTLTYAASPHILTQSVAMTESAPTPVLSFTSCTATPALPAGLNLNQKTCALSGTPTAGQIAKTYAINAVGAQVVAAGSLSIRVYFQPKFVYAANANDSKISIFNILSGGQLSAVVNVNTAANPFFVLPSLDAKFLYVANKSANMISVYTINQSTGALSEISGSPFATNALPYSLAFNPTGSVLYIGHESAAVQAVSAYSVNTSTGAITQISGSPFFVAAGSTPAAVMVSPDGKNLYVGSTQSTTNAHGFSINQTTGALTQLIGSPYLLINNAISVAAHPSGNFVYFAQYSAPTGIVRFRRDTSTGALTNLLPDAASGSAPTHLTTSVDGNYIFVANSGSSSVSGYKINATTGDFTGVSMNPPTLGTSPQGVAMDDTSTYLYVGVSGSDQVAGYKRDTVTGQFNATPSSPYTASDAPVHVIVAGGNP